MNHPLVKLMLGGSGLGFMLWGFNIDPASLNGDAQGLMMLVGVGLLILFVWQLIPKKKT